MAWEKVATLKDVPNQRVHYVEADGLPIALCNIEGSIYAIAGECTHDGGPLDQGSLEGFKIECPRHGALFDVRTGKPLTLPAVIPVHKYAVEVRGDEIFVDPDS